MKKRQVNSVTSLIVLVIFVAAASSGCSSASKGFLRAEMKPLQLGSPASTPKVLKKDHFKRDHSGSISESDLRRVLDAPVFLEADARLGVVPVATCYQPDPELPLAIVPHELSKALEDSGLFTVTTEVSTDWPADSGISGLRELAARYRSEYLLLYRHRFVDRSYTNEWGWFYLTVLGIFVAPSQTLETDGVLEATLFDVKTGTLLFTVFERVHNEVNENIWNNERKRRELKSKLLEQVAEKLADKVVHKSRLLAAARPQPESENNLVGGDLAADKFNFDY
ncbi:MAG: hypothetical protein JRJ87_21185 [Deltaproteobacteria bacterium]|nr:hypothetical protein [Deltaproteobacteria bacterium]